MDEHENTDTPDEGKEQLATQESIGELFHIIYKSISKVDGSAYHFKDKRGREISFALADDMPGKELASVSIGETSPMDASLHSETLYSIIDHEDGDQMEIRKFLGAYHEDTGTKPTQEVVEDWQADSEEYGDDNVVESVSDKEVQDLIQLLGVSNRKLV